MHPRTLAEQQPAVITIRADLVAQFGLRHEARVGVHARREQCVAARELVVMLGLRRELQLAGAGEIAIDRLFVDEPFDRVDARVEREIKAVRQFRAETLRQRRIILREAVVAHAAVASRRRLPDGARLADDHARALLGQRQRGGRTGDPAAHHHDVATAVGQLRRAAHEWLRRIEPVRTETHQALPSCRIALPGRRTFTAPIRPLAGGAARCASDTGGLSSM